MAGRSRTKEIVVLVVLVAICLAVGGIGGAVTASSVKTWYPTLNKPSFNPPDWVFGPVWTTLYILMALAAWRVWRAASWETARGPLVLFALQLAVNLGWSCTFFGMREIGLALAVLVILDLLVVATALAFDRVDRPAALLLVPYIAWISFATLLNFMIWRLN